MVLVSGCNLKDYWANRSKAVQVISQQQAKDRIETFINANPLPAGEEITVGNISDENGLYKVTITMKANGQSQDIDSYLSKDGQILFPSGGINIDDTIKQMQDAKNNPQAANASGQAAAQTPVKNAKPVVDLFVMSYCPYGTQMERGIIPAVQALGSKITFNLKFVSYTMHGDNEQDENLRQYCIEQNMPTKYLNYLQCFLKAQTGAATEAEACMASSGIAKNSVNTCMSATATKFNIAHGSTAFPIYADENTKYGVQGSPTLVINGVTSNSGRDPESILKAICGSFTTPPAECQKQLSTTAPAAGFGNAASAGSASASCGAPGAAAAGTGTGN